MPAPDDLYWNPKEIHPNHEDPYAVVLQNKRYIDSWDLENYTYLQQHLESVELNSDPSSLDSSGQRLSPDTYYRRPTNKYDHHVRFGYNYDAEQRLEDEDEFYASFGENYGLNCHYYDMNRFSIAEDKPNLYGYVPIHSRKTGRQDIYSSIDRTNQNRNRTRYTESHHQVSNGFFNGNDIYNKTEDRRRRYSEQPRTDFGKMQAEKLKLPAFNLCNKAMATNNRRFFNTSRLPEHVNDYTRGRKEDYAPDLEDSFESEESMLPIYNTRNMTISDIRGFNKNKRNSFSYGDYEYGAYRSMCRPSMAPNPLYGRLESVYGFPLNVGGISPLYDDIRAVTKTPATPKPDHFKLGNYGHLQIDYSCNWIRLNRYIKTI